MHTYPQKRMHSYKYVHTLIWTFMHVRTQDIRTHDQVLTSNGFIFAGYSEGVKETAKEGRVILTKEAARHECQNAIATINNASRR